jgi:hypothetical protein
MGLSSSITFLVSSRPDTPWPRAVFLFSGTARGHPYIISCGRCDVISFINTIDKISTWIGHAFACCIIVMTFGVGYEVLSVTSCATQPPGPSTSAT